MLSVGFLERLKTEILSGIEKKIVVVGMALHI